MKVDDIMEEEIPDADEDESNYDDDSFDEGKKSSKPDSRPAPGA